MPENRITSSKSATYRDPFKPATPRKRKTGSRAKLAKRFFEDVYAAWEEQGESVIARAFFHDPVASMQMVARLMPQKIEISTPTDGMSDERLAEMLEYAERMAGLRAEAARVIQGQAIEGEPAALPSPAQSAAPPASLRSHELADENGLCADPAEAGGGGPQGEMGGGGENTPSAIAAAEPDRPDSRKEHNGLDSGNPARTCESCDVELQPHEIELCDRCGAPTVLPYPVGKPFPPNDATVAARNKARLAGVDPVDPESLF